MSDLTNPETLALAAIVAGIVQACKQAGLPSNLAGILAILIGAIVAFATNAPVMSGVIAGLAAQGLYETVDTFRPGSK